MISVLSLIFTALQEAVFNFCIILSKIPLSTTANTEACKIDMALANSSESRLDQPRKTAKTILAC
jgi:hypothetical protein